MFSPESPREVRPLPPRCADTITTGIVRHLGLARTFSRKSHPEARGIRRSSRIRSGKRSRVRVSRGEAILRSRWPGSPLFEHLDPEARGDGRCRPRPAPTSAAWAWTRRLRREQAIADTVRRLPARWSKSSAVMLPGPRFPGTGAEAARYASSWVSQAPGGRHVPLAFRPARTPFSITPDPRFLFMSGRHRERLRT